MTKAEENELRIESQIGRNVADYIFNKAKKKAFNPADYSYGAGFQAVRLEDIQEICNQPPPIEKDMSAELKIIDERQRILSSLLMYASHILEANGGRLFRQEDVQKAVHGEFPIVSEKFSIGKTSEMIEYHVQQLTGAMKAEIERLESLLKQNSEGKEGTEGGGK